MEQVYNVVWFSVTGKYEETFNTLKEAKQKARYQFKSCDGQVFINNVKFKP